MASPTVNFDVGLSEAIASEGFSRGDSIGNRVAQGHTFDQMDPALRRLVAEKARTVTGDRSMLGQKDAQDFIQYGRRMPPTVNSPALTTTPPINTGLPTPRSPGGGAFGSETPAYAGTTTPTGGTTADLMSQIQRYGQPAAAPTTDYYSQELARQQKAIDASNARYAQLMDEARQTGVEQQNRGRAISNAAGALYSPRTEAMRAGVDDYTQKQINALSAQQAQEIAAAEGAANDRAYQLSRDASAAAATGSQNYISNLLQMYGLLQQDKAQASSTALAEAGLTGQYGGAPTLDFLNYQQDLKNDQFNRYVQQEGLNLSQDELALKREQFMQPSYDFVQLDDGSYGSWNPLTGKFERQGMAARATSGGGGSSSSSSSGGYGSPGYGSDALLDYFARFGKYPSDAGDIGTVENIYSGLQNRYIGEQGYYGPAYPSASELPNVFNYYYPNETGDGGLDLSGYGLDTTDIGEPPR